MADRKPYPDIFKELTPAKAWVLGLWYSDGCVARSSSSGSWTSLFSSLDLDLLQKVKSIIQDDSQPDRVHLREDWHRVYVCSADFAQHLIARGVIPRKSKTMLWPSWLTPELLPHFVRGLWDGDGSISITKEYQYLQLMYTSGSEDFLEGMVWAISPILGGFEPTLTLGNASWQFVITNVRVAKFAQWLYEGSEVTTRGNRKYARYQDFLRKEVGAHVHME